MLLTIVLLVALLAAAIIGLRGREGKPGWGVIAGVLCILFSYRLTGWDAECAGIIFMAGIISVMGGIIGCLDVYKSLKKKVIK